MNIFFSMLNYSSNSSFRISIVRDLQSTKLALGLQAPIVAEHYHILDTT